MKPNAVIQTLRELRDYAVSKGVEAEIRWSAEDSHMVRYANSAISLNSHEAISRLQVTVFGDHRQTSASLTMDDEDMETMRGAIDKAAGMLPFASAMTYQPTIPEILETTISEESYDPAIEEMTSAEIVAFVNEATQGLESEDILLSGNFSSGTAAQAVISTRTPHVVYWRASDVGITLVLASEKRKWEINAEQFVYRKADLDAKELHDRLAWLTELYKTRPEVRIPEGPCKVVMGPAATAEYLQYMSYIGFSGGSLKRGMSMFREDDVGKRLLSDKFTLLEDPGLRETFAMPVDEYGRRRDKRAIFDKGVLTGFLWDQQSADEFSQEASGHDVANYSLKLEGGEVDVRTIQELAQEPRDEDILYIPFMHYMNFVNPSEGLLTGISRFGALLLKKDGSIELPYNVRFTEKLGSLFNEKLVWLSKETVPYGSSTHYYNRDPYALLVPGLACFDGVKVEISNESFG